MLFTLLRPLIFKKLKKEHRLFLTISDILMIIAFLVYSFQELESVLSAQDKPFLASLSTLRYGTLLLVMRIALFHKLLQLINVLFIFVILILICFRDFNEENMQWLMALLPFGICYSYIVLLEES